MSDAEAGSGLVKPEWLPRIEVEVDRLKLQLPAVPSKRKS